MLLKKIAKKLFYWITILSVLVIIGFTGFYYSVKLGMFGDLPSNQDLKEIKNYEASEVYSSDSVLIGKFYVENRSNIKIEDVNPHIIQQLIATEDARFYEHDGFDKTGALRVIIKSIILQQDAGGGSTISQQLAKNLFGRNRHGILTMPVNKTKEVIIAQQLEELYTKDEILELYLNTVSFGEDTYGIKAGCNRFFNCSPMEISIENSAVLIGMLKAPTSYNPRLHPERSKDRRNVVLKQCTKYGYLEDSIYNRLSEKDIELDYNNLSNSKGLAPYFLQQVKLFLNNHLTGDKEDYFNLKTSGLKIYTTINASLQTYAEEAMADHIAHLQPQFFKNVKRNKSAQQFFQKQIKNSASYKNLKETGLSPTAILKALNKKQKRAININQEIRDSAISFIDSLKHMNSILHSGMYAINPNNGHVLVWVGDVNYQVSQYDNVTSKRQVGSVFKPFIYATAIENDYSPCSFIDNKKTTYAYYDDWTPSNADGNYEGKYSLVGGLTHSVNTISVKLCMDLGIKKVLEMVNLFGITDSLPEVPSIALGVGNISLNSMVNAYTAFVNKGKRIEPVLVTQVVNANGTVLFKSKREEIKVMEPNTAIKMTEMLNSVVENGTAKRLKTIFGIKGKMHGKTGTTQNHSDGWFMGFKQNFIAGVWVGATSPSVSFDNITQGQGANLALPIWANFYKKAYQDKSLRPFMMKEIDYKKSINCELYKEDNLFQRLFQKKEKTVRKRGLKENNVKSKIKRFFRRNKN